MKTLHVASTLCCGLILTATCQNASAQFSKYANQVQKIIRSSQSNNHGNQHHNGHQSHGHSNHKSHIDHYNPGHHVEHHNHVIRDPHGHGVGSHHHDVVNQHSTYVVPYSGHGNHQGAYHCRNDKYYYTPVTAFAGGHGQPRPVLVAFGSFSHVDDLAGRLEELTNELLLDLHYNYSHNHGFRTTYAEGYQLLHVAQYIHDAEHAHDRSAIRSQLNGMDALFHHLQDDVRGWSRHHHRQIGELGILSKMEMIESTLHHLMNDVGVHAAPSFDRSSPYRESAPAPLTEAPPPSLR